MLSINYQPFSLFLFSFFLQYYNFSILSFHHDHRNHFIFVYNNLCWHRTAMLSCFALFKVHHHICYFSLVDSTSNYFTEPNCFLTNGFNCIRWLYQLIIHHGCSLQMFHNHTCVHTFNDFIFFHQVLRFVPEFQKHHYHNFHCNLK